MPNMKWFELNRLQLGRYAEYYAKMEFASYGFEVYTSDVEHTKRNKGQPIIRQIVNNTQIPLENYIKVRSY